MYVKLTTLQGEKVVNFYSHEKIKLPTLCVDDYKVGNFGKKKLATLFADEYKVGNFALYTNSFRCLKNSFFSMLLR